MKKIIAAVAGAAALATAAAIPASSAFGASSACDRIGAQISRAEAQIGAIQENPNLSARQKDLLIAGLEARIGQLDSSASRLHCQ